VNAPKHVPAPINAVVYRDGAVSNDFQNYLSSPTGARTMKDSTLYETTDSCAILISYTFSKPPLTGPSGQIEPAGPGYYRVTIRMIKGEKVAIVLEESDYEVGYEMKISDGLSPDRGRYQGHRASTIADGYDIDSNLYIRGSNVGWNATVNLQFQNRKNFELLSRWNPWVWDTGWFWLLFKSSAPSTANVFGIFDGRPSKLLGVTASGVGVYTDPGGIKDMHGACDTLGNCHYVWKAKGKVWYKKINADGTSTTEEAVATNWTNPFVFIFDNTVNILAIDPLAAAGSQVKLLKKIGTGSFQTNTLSLDATLIDPVVYGASNGTHDFVCFFGTRNAQQGMILYSAGFNTTTFTYRGTLKRGSATRSADRPDFRRRKNGDTILTYTVDGSYQSYNVIRKDSIKFELLGAYPLGLNTITYGNAIDPETGNFFYVKNDRSLNYVKLKGNLPDSTTVDVVYSTPLNAFITNNDFDTLNRRSFAVDTSGNGLAFHSGYFFWFNSTTNVWSALDGAAWKGFKPLHLHYNTTDHKFYFVGVKSGVLKRYSYNGSGDPVFIENFASTEQPETGVRTAHFRVSPSGSYSPDIRFEWCIFAGKKGQDLAPANVVQPIAKTMHRLSGLASKVSGYENDMLSFNPSFASGAIYIPPSSVQNIIQKVKTDNAFYNYLIGFDPYFKDVMDAWRDATGTKANQLWQTIVNYSLDLKNALVDGDGIFSFNHFYINGGTTMRSNAQLASGLLADPNSQLTTTQKDSLKKIAALFARILWDDDFLPLFTEHGLNLGTPNMPQTYSGFRWFFALMLDGDLEFTARAATVPEKLQNGIASQINKHGAARGTPHYLQPPNDLFVFTALQLKNEDIQNKFTSSDTLKWFGEFLLHLRTPKSVRFSNQRKFICFGDGSEETGAILGLLGTGFAGVDNTLSKRLMYAYRNGPARSSDFGMVTLAINHDLPDTSGLKMNTGHFPGYLTTMRSAVNTPYESSLFFINGDWYLDHRNDDRGAIALYALGAPLSLNYGSFFYPWVPGAHMKSTPVPESLFPQWNQANQPFILPNNQTWYNSNHQTYLAFKNSAYSNAKFTRDSTWTRKAYQFSARTETPIFIIKDEFSDTTNNYIWNFNFMARDTVQTPGGSVDPPAAVFASPSASPEITLPANGMNKFTFKGLTWNAHPSAGIDWEVYLPSTNERKATLTEWAHLYAPAIEANEYQQTNGSSFEERQTILRVRGKKDFFTVIVPYNKGQRPTNLSVSKTGNVLNVECDSFDFETDLNYYVYEDGDKTILTTFTSQYLFRNGASIEDGPMELEIRSDTIIARLHGQTGARKVKLPETWWSLTALTPNASYNSTTGKWTLNHTFTDSLNNSYYGGFTEYVFVKVVRVAPKVFLQGPYNSGTSTMNDNLRSGGYLPLAEPYTSLNFTHFGSGGGETTWQTVLDVTGNNAIVDWVFVELRSKSNPATKIATRCALVQRDGDVVDTDGISPVNFHELEADSFYVAVRHRNHLGVCTAGKYAVNGNGVVTIDFTNPAVGTWGTNAQKDLGGSKRGMWGGDGNGDNKIVYAGSGTDVTPISSTVFLNPLNTAFSPSFPKFGYQRPDYNMDGKVVYAGSGTDVTTISSNVFLHPSNTGFSPSFPINEQLPN
jgi:hypothetical protein